MANFPTFSVLRTSTEPAAANEVQEQLARLHNQVITAHEALGALLTRISPVLKPDRPAAAENTASTQGGTAQSPIGNEIGSSTYQVSCLVARIEDAISRLAV